MKELQCLLVMKHGSFNLPVLGLFEFHGSDHREDGCCSALITLVYINPVLSLSSSLPTSFLCTYKSSLLLHSRVLVLSVHYNYYYIALKISYYCRVLKINYYCSALIIHLYRYPPFPVIFSSNLFVCTNFHYFFLYFLRIFH